MISLYSFRQIRLFLTCKGSLIEVEERAGNIKCNHRTHVGILF